MKIEFILDCELDGVKIKSGTKKTIPENQAQKLIDRGAAKQCALKKPKGKNDE